MATYTLTPSFVAEKVSEAASFGRNRLFYDDHPKAPRGFALRVTAKGVPSAVLNYWAEGKERRITVGRLGPNGTGLTLTAARERAAKLRAAVDSGGDPLAEREAKKAEQARQVEAARIDQERTLGHLLEAYADHLEAAGRDAAKAVRGMFKNHVQMAHPNLWRKPARDLEPEEGVAILGALTAAGKRRQAGKLRSYLRAAFAAAVRARLDASSSEALRALDIRQNPMADLPTLEGGSGKARERALTVAELRAYWRRICALPDPDGALLRFHLLTGGQRLAQLARVTELDPDVQAVIMRDAKGRRKEPRLHVVPLIPEAKEALDAMPGDSGPFLFSIDGGASGATYDDVGRRVQEVVAAMREADELEGEPFTPGDIRRTVETRLAALRVSKDIRAHLQSHGIAGVQDRHYDKHDYLDEKREALEALYRLATGTDATVTRIRSRETGR